nr:immunoglobulin light chain junction region [Macaca mulatta]MPO09275.1 immunoglobulin light chain junction region [Macaca mulatta]
CRIWHNNVYIF